MKSLRAAAFASVLRLAVPVLVGSATALACGVGPSNVAVGKLYVSGDPTYDQFFSELYQVQLPMGHAADRESQNRARVSNALGIPLDSTADQIADSLDQHAMHITKSGVTAKVASTGLDDPNATPTAELVTTGSGADARDTALLAALAESLRDMAALVGDVRRGKPSIDHLKPQADSLEPGIDQTFHKGGVPKKNEVRKNVVDAQRLIPLMSQRSDDIARLAADFIRKVQKVLGTAAPTAPAAEGSATPAPAAPAATPAAPAAKKPPGTGAPKPAAAAAPKPAPAEGAEAPKPEKKPEKKPAADDFEP